MNIDKAHFKELLSEVLDFNYEGENNSVYGIISAGNGLEHNLFVTFFFEDERIFFTANAPSLSLKDEMESEVLFFINKWNASYINQCVYYDNESKSFVMTGALFTDIELSDEYVLENFIRFYLSSSVHFFTEAGKAFHVNKKAD